MIRRWPALTRALVLTLMGVALAVPLVPVAANHGGTHHQVTSSDIAFWGDLAGPEPPFHFKVKIQEDGSTRAHGKIHLPDADPPAVLVAIPDSAVATFDDPDGDGIGLSKLTMQLRHPSTTEVVSFIFEPIKVIDGSGAYDVTLTVGNTTLTTEVEVRVTPDRREGRR